LPNAFRSQMESFGVRDNATERVHFAAKWNHLASATMRQREFISQPNGIIWRRRQCDRESSFRSQMESFGVRDNATERVHFAAKWNHLASATMRQREFISQPNGIIWRPRQCDGESSFRSQMESFGVRDNATERVHFAAKWNHLVPRRPTAAYRKKRSEEHTSELQSREKLVCRLLLE